MFEDVQPVKLIPYIFLISELLSHIDIHKTAQRNRICMGEIKYVMTYVKGVGSNSNNNYCISIILLRLYGSNEDNW